MSGRENNLSNGFTTNGTIHKAVHVREEQNNGDGIEGREKELVRGWGSAEGTETIIN